MQTFGRLSVVEILVALNCIDKMIQIQGNQGNKNVKKLK